jgi:hypothetical protein
MSSLPPPGSFPPPGQNPYGQNPPGGGFPPPPPPPPSWYGVGPSGYGGPPPGEDPLVSSDVGSWFSKAFAVLGKAWKQMLVVHLVAAVPTFVLTVPFATWAEDLQIDVEAESVQGGDVVRLLGAGAVVSIVTLVVSTWGTLCAFWIGARAANGDSFDFPSALRFGLRRLLPYLGWAVLAGLLTGVGFLLCLVPGIWLGVVFYSSLLGVVAFEQGRYGSAFSRCFALNRNHWWSNFGRLLLMILLGLVWGAVVGVVGGAVGGDSLVVGQLVSSIAGAGSGVVSTALLLVLYAERRNAEQPITTRALVAELGA